MQKWEMCFVHQARIVFVAPGQEPEILDTQNYYQKRMYKEKSLLSIYDLMPLLLQDGWEPFGLAPYETYTFRRIIE